MRTGFRKWLARKISPELALAETRMLRLRHELSTDRHWLGYDFPEIDVFALRALVMDANYARAIDEKPYSSKAGGVDWSHDIYTFREQLRREFRSEATR